MCVNVAKSWLACLARDEADNLRFGLADIETVQAHRPEQAVGSAEGGGVVDYVWRALHVRPQVNVVAIVLLGQIPARMSRIDGWAGPDSQC